MGSRRTCSIPGAPAAFQAHLQHSRHTCSIPGTPVAFTKKMFFPDCSTVNRGAPRVVAGAPRLVAGTPRPFKMNPKFSLALRGVAKLITITPMVLL